MSQGSLSLRATPSIGLLDVPAPPEGYRFERMLALTYSLDARIAIALLAAAFGRSAELEEESAKLDLQSLNAFDARAFVRRVLEKSLFLVNHSGDPIKGDLSREMSSLLQDRIFTVFVSGRGATGERPLVNFHPKLILVEFSREKDKRWTRIYVGSRNLSLGSARETGTVLDFPPEKKRKRARLAGGPILRPLQSYLDAMQSLAFSGTGKLVGTTRHRRALSEWRDAIQAMIRARRSFIADKTISSAALLTQWPGSQPLATSVANDLKVAKSALVVSPWVDATAARFLADQLPHACPARLWTLESERHNLEPLRGRRAQVVTEAVDSLYEQGVEKEVGEIGFLWRLHAKAYALDFRSGGALWLGSANFTRPGLGLQKHPAANFELLLRLETRGPASRWFGRLPTKSLDSALAGLEVPTAKEEELPEPLEWLRATWINYPASLRVEIAKPRLAGKQIPDYCRTIRIDGFDSFGGRVLLGTVPWKRLWRTGRYDVQTGLTGSRLNLDALLTFTPNGLPGSARFIHVPVPDAVASARVSKVVDARMDASAALERLLQLQGGLSSNLRKGNGQGKKGNIAAYIAGLRLERLFLRLIEDESDDAMADLTDIIRCLKKDNRPSQYASLVGSLDLIAAGASRVRSSRR